MRGVEILDAAIANELREVPFAQLGAIHADGVVSDVD
jgi:hypothetical protein